MAENTFLIASLATGPDPDDWDVVEDELAAISLDITLRALEWEYQSYVSTVRLANGQDFGRGYPTAAWKITLRPEQREYFREYCSGLSADVYIRTPTNETSSGELAWSDFQAIMHWTAGPELYAVNAVEEVTMIFTHMVQVET
jgi:hypothetical protein